MIYVIDDDMVMAECIKKAAGLEAKIFSNAIEAMDGISDGDAPELIFLDILLDGPDGFTFLNELTSYSDTGNIPVVIISSLDFGGKDLSHYGVVGVLNKDEMLPSDIRNFVRKYVVE